MAKMIKVQDEDAGNLRGTKTTTDSEVIYATLLFPRVSSVNFTIIMIISSSPPIAFLAVDIGVIISRW